MNGQNEQSLLASKITNENTKMKNKNLEITDKKNNKKSNSEIMEDSEEGFLPEKEIELSNTKDTKKKEYFELMKNNPDEVIYHNEPEAFNFTEEKLVKRVILFLLLLAPSLIVFFISNIFKDFCLTQMVYQMALIAIMKTIETLIEVDYAVILIKDMRFVKQQIRAGVCHFLFFGIIIPILISVICSLGIYQFPIGLNLLLPLLEVPQSSNWETIVQTLFLMMYFISFVVTLPVIEQRYFYQFIQSQIGRSSFAIQLVTFLAHFLTFGIEIFKAFFYHDQTHLFWVAIVFQLIMVFWYAKAFNKSGFIESVLNQMSKHFMLWVFCLMLYFTPILNQFFDISYFIQGKNSFDCIFYSFYEDERLHC